MNNNFLQEYISTHYVAPRMVVAGAGGVEHKDLVSLSENLFGGVPETGPQEVCCFVSSRLSFFFYF